MDTVKIAHYLNKFDPSAVLLLPLVSGVISVLDQNLSNANERNCHRSLGLYGSKCKCNVISLQWHQPGEYDLTYTPLTTDPGARTNPT